MPIIFLDLEDAVSPNDKVTARENVINALKDLDWEVTVKQFLFELMAWIRITCIEM